LMKGAQTYADAFRNSKDPTTFLVLFEDTAALLGLLIAAAGIAATRVFDAPRLDGVASVGIALVLLVSSLLLVRETKGLLIGETAHARTREAIFRAAAQDSGVRRANGVLTLQLGANQVVAALSLEFHETLSTKEIERCVTRIETAVGQASPMSLPCLSSRRQRKLGEVGSSASRRFATAPTVSLRRAFRPQTLADPIDSARANASRLMCTEQTSSTSACLPATPKAVEEPFFSCR
jgi:hypothetical protein